MITLKRPDGNLPEDFHLSRRGIAGGDLRRLRGRRPLGRRRPDPHRRRRPRHRDRPAGDRRTAPISAAYVARPKAAGRFPAVIVVNEVFGLHAYILDICRRFAKLGYVAIAPGFFDRAGDPAPLTDVPAGRDHARSSPRPATSR